MKNFFKKIWDSIKSFFEKSYKWVKNLLKSVPQRYLYTFSAGLILAAFQYIILSVEGCIFAPLFLFLFICFIRLFCNKDPKWWDFGAATIGGALIQLMVFFA